MQGLLLFVQSLQNLIEITKKKNSMSNGSTPFGSAANSFCWFYAGTVFETADSTVFVSTSVLITED